MKRKLDLEQFATPPVERAPAKKVIWPFMLMPDVARRLREFAATRGTSISEGVSVLMTAGLPHVSFPPLQEGITVRMVGSSHCKPTRYFIPLEVAQKLQEWQDAGYSNTILTHELIQAGFANVDRKDPKGSPDLRTGTLEESPESNAGVAVEPEGEEVSAGPKGGPGDV